MPLTPRYRLLLQMVTLLVPAAASAQTSPVLSFPEANLDDPATYQGYQTRFYRDAARNTIQIYVDERAARVVHLWADGENESLAFTARRPDGSAAPLRWNSGGATLAGGANTRRRTLNHSLLADGSAINLGWFLLGSMRVERDFQFEQRQRVPFSAPPFRLAEFDRLVAALGTLDAGTRREHLAALNAGTLADLERRRHPTITPQLSPLWWTARVTQPSLDGRDTLWLEIRVRRALVDAALEGDSIVLRARRDAVVPFDISVSTSGAPLTPLARTEIFTPEFLTFLARTRADAPDPASDAGLNARRLERQVRGVELLSSREKLMAGLPTYATYFGRDMLMSALMMRTIWRPAVFEAVIAAALRKLSPAGEVSHEEALGGQAVREAAGEYAALLEARTAAARQGATAVADSLLRRAGDVLRNARRTRENYHMVDDELQLPVVVSRWISDTTVSAARKRAFLRADGGTGTSRLTLLLRELALVAEMTAPYAEKPAVAQLISFAPRDVTGWASQSWRDSGVGYAGGRYAMDVNMIWAPQALESMARILAALRALQLPVDAVLRSDTTVAASTAFVRWAHNASALDSAAKTWRAAEKHFVVTRSASEVRANIAARLAAMPADERAHWSARRATNGTDADALTFLAVSLDAAGAPIAVANTDPATRLFLGEHEGQPMSMAPGQMAITLRDVQLFTRAYPAGLLIDGIGPAVSNDAYAPASVWDAFVKDPYHGPRVIWGREVNLFLLGAADRVRSASKSSDPAVQQYANALRSAINQVRQAVDASGFHSELWSYSFTNGKPGPTRYGSGSDVQLWSTTDLAVAFALAQLPDRK